MVIRVQGVVHGQTIEVEQDLGLLEGQRVRITIEEPLAETDVQPPMSAELRKVYEI